MINKFDRTLKLTNIGRIVNIPYLLFILSVIFLGSSFVQATGIETSDHFGTYGTFSEGIHGGTLPRLELLSGVLSHTSWMKRRGPSGPGNVYFQELHAFFKPYKDHIAIKIAEQLTKDGFNYDAPPNFVLSLSALPDLEAKKKYSDYLIGRVRSKKQLEQFRLALKQLSEESEFLEFYKHHAEKYKEWVRKSTVNFDAKKLTGWLENFFGWSGEEFHLVFAPAMFRTGGYAAHYTIGKKLIAYQVIREHGKSIETPYFGNSKHLEIFSLHELGHAFVNPSIEAHQKLINDLRIIDFYKKNEKQMQKQAYGTVNTFLNESVLRAVTAIGRGEFANDIKVQRQWSQREKSKGFFLQDVIVNSLLKYQKNRSEYSTFRDYVPTLLKDISNARSELL